jgi:ABC-2 type transport system ATP-binding protein
MDEAQQLAQRVAIIARGEIVAEGTPATIGGRDTAKTLIRFRVPAGLDPRDSGVAELTVKDGVAELLTQSPTAPLHALTGWAADRGAELEGLSVSPRSLEDVYLELTGTAEGMGEEQQEAVPAGGRGSRRGRRG